MKNKAALFLTAFALALTMVFTSVFIVPAAVQGVMGLAVAIGGNQYRDIKDYSVGDSITNGIMMAGCMLWNGASADRCRGDIAFGLDVDVTRLPGGSQTPADAFTNPSTFLGTWTLPGLFNGTTWDRWRSAQTTGINTAMTTGLPAAGMYGYDFTGSTQNRYRAIRQIGGDLGSVTNVTGSFANITTNTDTYIGLGSNVAWLLQRLIVGTAGATSQVVIRSEPDGSAPCGGAGSAIIGTFSTLAQAVLEIGNLYVATNLCLTTTGGTPANLTLVYAGDSE